MNRKQHSLNAAFQFANLNRDNQTMVDINQATYFPGLNLNRWLAVRLESLGAFVTFGSAIFILLFPESVDSSEVGLVITYSLSITQELH